MSGFVTPLTPNITDYATFLLNIGMTPTVLPPDSPWIGYAYNQAIGLVNPYGQCYGLGLLYTLAVYNCGAHIQIQITPDQAGETYFQTLRGPGEGGFNITGFTPGVVSASSDEGSSTTLEVSDAFKSLALMDLNFLTTPYGRQYLAYAQQSGPVWGLS
jgi:hypothetical protein